MQYAIIVYETDASMSARDDAARAPAYWSSYVAYARALREAGILTEAGRPEAARAAYERAIGLTEDPATRRYLAARAARVA